jgi:uncharacterized membrane protein YtjA (UPF0391 family)
MLYLALACLAVSLIARSLGYPDIATVSAKLSWVLFLIAAVLLAIHLAGDRRRRNR